MKKIIITAATLSFLILLLLFPTITLKGAKNGLLLWFETVLPTLLPFLIVSNFMVQFRITDCLTSFLYPVAGKLFGISRAGCYPMLIGMLSGYPVGAKACADLVKDGQISKEEGQFLLCFCNNASPMFLISFIATQCLQRGQKAFLILLIIYSSGLLTACTYRLICHSQKNVLITAYPVATAPIEDCRLSPFTVLDTTILNAFIILTKAGGYIILFSILAEIILHLSMFPAGIRYFFLGFLEITTGTAAIGIASFPFTQKIVLINALTAFGGLSSHAQTFSVIMHSGLSMKKYFLFKCINAGFAGILTFFFLRAF